MPLKLTFLDKSERTMPYPFLSMADIESAEFDESHLLNIERFVDETEQIKSFATTFRLVNRSEDDIHILNVRSISNPQARTAETVTLNDAEYVVNKDDNRLKAIKPLQREIARQHGLLILHDALNNPDVTSVEVKHATDGRVIVITPVTGKTMPYTDGQLKLIDSALSVFTSNLYEDLLMNFHLALGSNKVCRIEDKAEDVQNIVKSGGQLNSSDFYTIAEHVLGGKWVCLFQERQLNDAIVGKISI